MWWTRWLTSYKTHLFGLSSFFEKYLFYKKIVQMWQKAKMERGLVITILIFNLTRHIQWLIHISKLKKSTHSTIPQWKIIIIIIIVLSCHQHGYPWVSIATPPYRFLLSAGPQSYIPNRHRADVCRFELDVLPLLVHVRGSTGVHHLWARPYFSSSVLRVWFV